ncbi:hypothetical protein F5887DRAFT_918923 [Amanita rubescens]|nr:hypothetical protein F5887DRAFT_918923 [Amanita rubescens]
MYRETVDRSGTAAARLGTSNCHAAVGTHANALGQYQQQRANQCCAQTENPDEFAFLTRVLILHFVQILVGGAIGLVIALAIGAADALFSKIELLWTATVKWRSKTEKASEGESKWIIPFLPFTAVLREGLEVVVYVGGVSLGEPALGLIAGLAVGVIVYQFAI